MLVGGFAVRAANAALDSAASLKDVQAAEKTAPGERKILYWVAPMDPGYRRDRPGKSPMGMDLVPVYADDGGAGVRISPAVVQNLGVRTAPAERGRLWRRIDTVGYVDYDQNRISHVHLRTDGWIERLSVKSVGEGVKQGQLLFELYSPTLVNAQEEYLQALSMGNRKLLQASADRLTALGISRDQARELRKTRKVTQRIKVYAPQNGIVSTLSVREGMYVKPATEVMSLTDLSSVWLMAEVFERQTDWVKVGQSADVRLSYLPGRKWEGRVQFVYPSLDPKTRTLRVRLRFDNPGEVLKPNMYANVIIYGGAKTNVVIIPREALIRTGRGQRVILDAGDGRYVPRKVVAGIESGDFVEIVAGLAAGERVVTSGQFLIDSEASLKASMQRMTEPKASAAPTGQMDQGRMEHGTAKQMEQQSAAVRGTGVIKALMPDAGKITLQHDPIPAIGWSAMTMDFRVQDGVSLAGLKVGAKVEFELRKGAGGYVINAIRPAAQ